MDEHQEQRNTNLNEISNAVTVEDEDAFKKSSFGLKRTQSMGVLDQYRPSTASELVGTTDDYPHLEASSRSTNSSSSGTDNTASYIQQPSVLPTSEHSEDVHETSSTSEDTHHVDYDYYDSGDEYYEEEEEEEQPVMPGSPEISALNDDSAVQHEPSRHVDYLSHNWKESDISASWRYIVMRRKDVANAARLENASWRTWTKAKYNLKTVSPESVNWLKDYDVTWLYGPLYEEPAQSYTLGGMPPLSPTLYEPDEPKNEEKNGLTLSTKPILKKKSASQKILDTPSGTTNEADFYFRQHNYRQKWVLPEVQSRINSQYEPKLQTPEPLDLEEEEKKNEAEEPTPPAAPDTPQPPVERHIHFNDRVEQCRALAYISSEDEAEEDEGSSDEEEEDEDEDEDDEAGLFLMVRSPSQSSIPTLNTLNKLKTIESMPATTLKYDIDDSEREARQLAEVNSVAYAMSHNTANRRHVYKTYDYNSVFESPEPSPNHSPRSGSYESFSRTTEPIAQTTTETAQGQFSNDITSEFVEDAEPETSPEPEHIQQEEERREEEPVDDDHVKLDRVTSAVNAAKEMASSIWHWKK